MYIEQDYKHYEKYDVVRFLNPQEMSKVIAKAIEEGIMRLISRKTIITIL